MGRLTEQQRRELCSRIQGKGIDTTIAILHGYKGEDGRTRSHDNPAEYRQRGVIMVICDRDKYEAEHTAATPLYTWED